MWAWQMATASASAVSCADRPAAGQEHADHQRHLLLARAPGAGDRALDLLGGIFGDRRGRQWPAASRTTPRAWPSLRELKGLRLTTVSSTAAASAPSPRITSASPR